MKIIDSISSAVFGAPTLLLLVFSGIFFCVKTRFFVFRHAGMIIRKTFCSLFRSDSRRSCGERISKLQSMLTALAATIGTGSMTGVASAIAIGGRGAVFWMWISALVGMSTAYAEGVLSVKYREKSGGSAMCYIKQGLKSRGAAFVYAALSVGAAFGMGDIVQTSSIAAAARQTFGIPPAYIAAALALVIAAVSMGGLKRTAYAAQAIVPFMGIVYIAGCFAVLILFRENIIPTLGDIFKSAFGIRQAAGGAVGAAISAGFRRGVFSNEAGLGTTAAVHACSQTDEPAEQGMWNIFEVFIDTVLICTLTALAITVSGADKVFTGEQQMISEAFSSALGGAGKYFCSASVILFAFSTVIGWSVIGERAFSYIFPRLPRCVYCALFTVFGAVGCLITSETAFAVSDIFNGLMAYPNLAALFMLSGEVRRETEGYIISKRERGGSHGSRRSRKRAVPQCE